MPEWSIKYKRAELDLHEKELKKDAKILEAEKQFLQSVCEHPNKQTWTHHCYDGSSDTYEECGLRKTVY